MIKASESKEKIKKIFIKIFDIDSDRARRADSEKPTIEVPSFNNKKVIGKTKKTKPY